MKTDIVIPENDDTAELPFVADIGTCSKCGGDTYVVAVKGNDWRQYKYDAAPGRERAEWPHSSPDTWDDPALKFAGPPRDARIKELRICDKCLTLTGHRLGSRESDKKIELWERYRQKWAAASTRDTQEHGENRRRVGGVI